MSSPLKIALGVGCGILLAIGALVVGCTLLLGYGANKVQEQEAAKAQHVTVKVDAFREEGDWFQVDGTVTNTADSPVTFVKVNVDFVTSSGTVVDSDWTYAIDSNPLQPGASRKFSVQQRSTPGVETARVRLLTE